MNIMITGANGFVGKNLVVELRNKGYENLFLIDRNSSLDDLDNACSQADFVYHLAGINRPKDDSEFVEGNIDFTSNLLSLLEKHNNKAPIAFSSSTQALLDNPYGKSKREAEIVLENYSKKHSVQVYIYRFNNLYGKWSKPNYNTVVATFCYKIARNEEVIVNDPSSKMSLSYIDDVVRELLSLLDGKGNKVGNFYEVKEKDEITVGQLKEYILGFKEMRDSLQVPKLDSRIEKNLYSTYLSLLPKDGFSYPLKMNIDERGSFTEIVRTPDRGQFSVNIIKPNITKGNHWHHTKNEKFLVASGQGVIRFRKIVDEDKIIEYYVSGDKLEVVDIPVGYTHNIENLGDNDMVVFMWVNEAFDPNNPDTYFEKV